MTNDAAIYQKRIHKRTGIDDGRTVVTMAMAMVVVMRMRMMMVLITMATTMAMRREVKESQAAGSTILFYFTFRATVSAVASIHNIHFQPCEFHNHLIGRC